MNYVYTKVGLEKKIEFTTSSLHFGHNSMFNTGFIVITLYTPADDVYCVKIQNI